MHANNDPEEIRTCILLEEFKRTAPQDRLRNFGYCKMLKLLLFIEDSFSMNEVESNNLNNHYVQKVSTITYKIMVNYK